MERSVAEVHHALLAWLGNWRADGFNLLSQFLAKAVVAGITRPVSKGLRKLPQNRLNFIVVEGFPVVANVEVDLSVEATNPRPLQIEGFAEVVGDDDDRFGSLRRSFFSVGSRELLAEV
jgi:hypothetical protein